LELGSIKTRLNLLPSAAVGELNIVVGESADISSRSVGQDDCSPSLANLFMPSIRILQEKHRAQRYDG
jgi:hypothetical protein